MASRRAHPVLSAATAAVLVLGVLATGQHSLTAGASPVPRTAGTTAARTSAREAARVDRVKAPTLHWHSCYGWAQCTTARLPRDYDEPTGAQVSVALLRIRARDQQHRVGTLFVNPGGPGGSGTDLAYRAPDLLSAGVLDRFDVVGFDPRGTNASSAVTCFPSTDVQAKVLADLYAVAVPTTGAEEKRVVRGAAALGRACSSTGRPVSTSMSTAEVARDLEVLRRSVGDQRLSYLGFSYGSYLGEVYANLFPDRFRVLALDGVVDPVAWAGTPGTRDDPVSDRLRGADGATAALHELLTRCDRVGRTRCSFAAGDPRARLAQLADRLRREPIVQVDVITGEEVVFGYGDLVAAVRNALYDPHGYLDIISLLTTLTELTGPPASLTQQARTSALTLLRRTRQHPPRRPPGDPGTTAAAAGDDYDSSVEANLSVLCTDSRNPVEPIAWATAADAADRRARYFGRQEVWTSAACAGRTWTARDEDAYWGPFNRRTTAPVLLVGSRWDPSTSYRGAVRAAALLPNSRLLRSDNWGHTAYGTSACVTRAVDRYLLTGVAPAAGRRCLGDVQPFSTGTGSSQVRRTLALRRW